VENDKKTWRERIEGEVRRLRDCPFVDSLVFVNPPRGPPHLLMVSHRPDVKILKKEGFVQQKAERLWVKILPEEISGRR